MEAGIKKKIACLEKALCMAKVAVFEINTKRQCVTFCYNVSMVLQKEDALFMQDRKSVV